MAQQGRDPPLETDASSATLSVEHIGGIDQCTVQFTPGVTILTGRNATNRTSLLRALNGVLGGSAAALKSDAEEGTVTLELNGEEFRRQYKRTETGIDINGEPYTGDETIIDLCVSLHKDNPARLAVERGEDLYDVIMNPVDIDAIERRIQDLQRERDGVRSEHNRVRKRLDELPRLEEERQDIEDEVSKFEEELESLRDEVADVESDIRDAEEAEEVIEQLDDLRQELNHVLNDQEVVEAEINALHDERNELITEREELTDGVDVDLPNLEAELEEAREQKRRLDEIVNSLTAIIDFNDDVLHGDGRELPGVQHEDDDPLAELGPEDKHEVVCWTCGSIVDHGSINDRLDDLRTLVEEKRNERTDLVERIRSISEKVQTHEEQRRRRQQLERKIEETEEKIDQRKLRLEEAESNAADLRAKIQDLEEEMAETDVLDDTGLLDKYERLSDLQYERARREQRLEDVNQEIEEIESLPEPSQLEDHRDELTEELERERSRVDDIETEVVETFNEHVDEILDVLGYENLARVWIERKRSDDRSGNLNSEFDLHIVREDDTGSVYEDTVDHLSESEREVVGIMVALAGYLAHNADETVPFVLLDSLEAIDSDRIAELVAYFADIAAYLLVALLPEDASSIPDDHQRIQAPSLTS